MWGILTKIASAIARIAIVWLGIQLDKHLGIQLTTEEQEIVTSVFVTGLLGVLSFAGTRVVSWWKRNFEV